MVAAVNFTKLCPSLACLLLANATLIHHVDLIAYDQISFGFNIIPLQLFYKLHHGVLYCFMCVWYSFLNPMKIGQLLALLQAWFGP